MTVYGEEAARFVQGAGMDFGEHQAIGWARDGRIVAGAVFHNWNPEKGTIELTVAGKGAWMTRGRAAAIFDYAFGFCRMAWGRTESPAVRRAIRRLGGDEYEIPGLWAVVTLTREQWLRYRDGCSESS